MTVELAFRRDDLALRDLGPDDDEALFHETVLVVPIRFRVGDTDMLGAAVYPSTARDLSAGPDNASAWIELRQTEAGWDHRQPLIGFLTSIRAAIRIAAGGRSAAAYLASSPLLHFDSADGDRLSVRLGRGEAATAPTNEFVTAVDQFGEAVKAWLREAGPQLEQHAGWASWFDVLS